MRSEVRLLIQPKDLLIEVVAVVLENIIMAYQSVPLGYVEVDIKGLCFFFWLGIRAGEGNQQERGRWVGLGVCCCCGRWE